MLPSQYVREDDDWSLQVLRITILVGHCQPRLAARVEGSDQTRKLYQMYCFNLGFTILPIPDGMLPSVFRDRADEYCTAVCLLTSWCSGPDGRPAGS